MQFIDACLRMGKISDDEHNAAIFLRKLYFLVFGGMHIKSNAPNVLSKKSVILPAKVERKAYKVLMKTLNALREKGYYEAVTNACVFDNQSILNHTLKDGLKEIVKIFRN